MKVLEHPKDRTFHGRGSTGLNTVIYPNFIHPISVSLLLIVRHTSIIIFLKGYTVSNILEFWMHLILPPFLKHYGNRSHLFCGVWRPRRLIKSTVHKVCVIIFNSLCFFEIHKYFGFLSKKSNLAVTFYRRQKSCNSFYLDVSCPFKQPGPSIKRQFETVSPKIRNMQAVMIVWQCQTPTWASDKWKCNLYFFFCKNLTNKL